MADQGTPSTKLQETPLGPWHVAHGARMVDFAGWSMPVQYTSIVREHTATRTTAGLFDISHMGRFRFDGVGAVAFLDGLLTRRVTNLAAGQIRYSLVTDERGGILDDVLVYCLQESSGTPFYLLVVNAGNRDKMAAWISAHLGDFSEVQFRDQTEETAMIAVQGPAAAQLVAPIVAPDSPPLDYYTGIVGGIAGKPSVLSRTGYTGEDGYELIVSAESATEVWQRLLAADPSAGALPAGLGARDTLRLEAGMPLYGHELLETINPFQAGLGFAVQLRDREFVGSRALRELKQQPGQDRRIGLELSGRRVPRERYEVFCDEQQVGAVTSGTYSPTLERPIAMAYVRPEFATVGTTLAVAIRGKREPATVVGLPFYSR